MKISIDTKEDSHEEIRKVIKMLQNLVGDQEVFTNQPASNSATEESSGSPFENIFGGTASAPESQEIATPSVPPAEEASESTEDLFAELFSEEELKKMDVPKEEPEIKPKDKKYKIEFY